MPPTMPLEDNKLLEAIDKLRGKAGLWGFEPQFEAPEASVISKLHYRPATIGIIKSASSSFEEERLISS